MELPAILTFMDMGDHKRSEVQIKWWKDSANISWKEYSMNSVPGLKGNPPKANYGFYSLNEKLVFFGHYWCIGTPELLHPNICCLDYSVANGGQLIAYRKNGEFILTPDNFVETTTEKEEVWPSLMPFNLH